ncbi:hypothetical protein GS504_03920 [Rhodococcus hoagii]|nr:hypothetical protein [Prescottella equi]NKS56683.1 hypothetical protein [Prescottella equi]NKS68784.1 hypothetical protein [Prescottella equi]
MNDTQQVSVGEGEKTDTEQVPLAEGGKKPESAEDEKESEDAAPPEAENQPSSTRQKIWKALTKRIELPWWIGLALTFVSSFVFAFVLGVGLRLRWGSGQWGDVATWLSGFATLAAVLVALWQTVISREAAAKATQEAAAAKQQAVLDSAAAKKDADDRLEREIAAYRDRVEAQLKKSDDLYERQARAEALAVQRSELMVFWPVLDETFKAAMDLPRAVDVIGAVRKQWEDQRIKLNLAHARAMLFVYDPDVSDAIDRCVDTVNRFTEDTDRIASGEKVVGNPEDPGGPRTRVWHIATQRTALQQIASARLTDFAPDSVVAEADKWKSRAPSETLQPEHESDGQSKL